MREVPVLPLPADIATIVQERPFRQKYVPENRGVSGRPARTDRGVQTIPRIDEKNILSAEGHDATMEGTELECGQARRRFRRADRLSRQ